MYKPLSFFFLSFFPPLFFPFVRALFRGMGFFCIQSVLIIYLLRKYISLSLLAVFIVDDVVLVYEVIW